MSTATRSTGLPNKDNTFAVLNNDSQTIPYAATINFTPKIQAFKTILQLGTLTGACTINLGVGTSTTAPYVGDEIVMFVASDGTTRTITWGTGCLPVAATFAVTTGKYARISAVFNGTGWIISPFISA